MQIINFRRNVFPTVRWIYIFFPWFFAWLERSRVIAHEKNFQAKMNYNCLITRLFKELKSSLHVLRWQIRRCHSLHLTLSCRRCFCKSHKKHKLRWTSTTTTTIVFKFKNWIDGVTKSNKRDRSLKDIEMFVDWLTACMCCWNVMMTFVNRN